MHPIFLLVLNTLFIFLLIPSGRNIFNFFNKYYQESIFNKIIVISFGFVLIYLFIKLLASSFNKKVYMIPVLASILLLIYLKRESGAEIAHIILFSSLVLTSYKYFSKNGINVSKEKFISTIFYCLLISTIDEICQWFTIGRYGEISDVILNLKSSLIVWFFLILSNYNKENNRIINKPNFTPYALASIFIFSLLIIFNITPKNAQFIGEKLNLSEKRKNHYGFKDGTVAYGYKHKLDNDVYLKSRRKNLFAFKNFDNEIINKMESQYSFNEITAIRENSKNYWGNFTKKLFPESARWISPIKYETEVRLFSRQRNLEKAELSNTDEDLEKYLQRAWVEDQILKKLTPNIYSYISQDIFNNSKLNQNFIKKFESFNSKNIEEKMISRVSKNLLTIINQSTINFFLITLIAISTLLTIKIIIIKYAAKS